MQLVAKASDSDVPVRADLDEERLRVNLERFIRESGYSVTQVADLAGMTQATLRRYVTGENAIPGSVLRPLAEVFGRDVGDFYQPNPPPPPKDLDVTQPIFLRSRPGYNLTEEDLADFRKFLERVRERREKKKPRR